MLFLPMMVWEVRIFNTKTDNIAKMGVVQNDIIFLAFFTAHIKWKNDTFRTFGTSWKALMKKIFHSLHSWNVCHLATEHKIMDIIQKELVKNSRTIHCLPQRLKLNFWKFFEWRVPEWDPELKKQFQKTLILDFEAFASRKWIFVSRFSSLCIV